MFLVSFDIKKVYLLLVKNGVLTHLILAKCFLGDFIILR